MVIIGLSPIVHESAVGVVGDNHLLAAAAEERFTRVKNQGGFPHNALASVMKQAGVSPSDVDYVAYAALPYVRERSLDIQAYLRNIGYTTRYGGNVNSRTLHVLNYTRNMLVTKEWQTCGAP